MSIVDWILVYLIGIIIGIGLCLLVMRLVTIYLKHDNERIRKKKLVKMQASKATNSDNTDEIIKNKK